MHNIVIVKIAQALAVRSIAALAFNFRGAGRSGGRFAEGIGEQDDVLAALEWLRQQAEVDKERVGLAGYSFGGGVALEAACRTDAVNALALLAPWTGKPAGGWENCRAATYILGGSVDDVYNETLSLFSICLSEELKIIDGGSFWRLRGAAVEREQRSLKRL
jgi:alpha/beta superfamily hydrolase